MNLDQTVRYLTCGYVDFYGAPLYCVRLITFNVSQWYSIRHIHISTITFFHLIRGSHVWIKFYLHFPHFMSFFFCFPLHPVCLVLSSILITEIEFELYSIFTPSSWHIVRLGPNIFILQLYFQYINPRFTMLCHQIFIYAMDFVFHTVHPYKPQQRLILCTPHNLINYMPL